MDQDQRFFTPGIVRPRKPAFIAGATIEVTGPAWASSITTDLCRGL